MKIKIHTPVILAASLLLAGTLACSTFVGGPEYPAASVTSSPEEVTTLQTQIEQAYTAGAESGVISLQITESQITSYLSQKLMEQSAAPFSDPLVLLRDGKMEVYGRLNNDGVFKANMHLTINISLDPATGIPQLAITTADFGPLPAPESITSAISAMVDEAFTGTLGPVATGLRLETIQIADGVMYLTGRIK